MLCRTVVQSFSLLSSIPLHQVAHTKIFKSELAVEVRGLGLHLICLRTHCFLLLPGLFSKCLLCPQVVLGFTLTFLVHVNFSPVQQAAGA